MRAIIVLIAFTNAASAQCMPDEQTFMSCEIAESGKSLRVCFDETTTFYRFGDFGQSPELELAESIATVDYEPWSGVGRSIAEGVRFRNKGYYYHAYAGFERMFGDEEYEDVPFRSFGGVRVLRNDALILELSCNRQAVDFAWGEGLYTAKTNLGYTWDVYSREWVDLPD
jgi:hypothetical protein